MRRQRQNFATFTILPIHLALEQWVGLLMALFQKTLQGALTFGVVNEKVKVT